MTSQIIEQLIKGEYSHKGQGMIVPVKSVRIEGGLSSHAHDLIEECGLIGKALVVADVNTNAVLGEKIADSLGAISLVLENGVKADEANVAKIKDAAKSVDYIVAVGSGTINDLCKYTSFQMGKPYVVFGTAPSMNGYGSANASITVSGHKKTLKAHLPQGIFLDLDILAKAPLRLIRSGLGDSVCRSTAQADWLLSHLLLDTYYTDVPFELLKGKGLGAKGEGFNLEAELFDSAKYLVNGDVEAMRLLASTLVLSGFGMYIAGGSYPASQGEHMIAHTMEMAHQDKLPHSYHGEQIAVTTLTMARLQEKVLGEGCHSPSLPLANYRAIALKDGSPYNFEVQNGRNTASEMNKQASPSRSVFSGDDELVAFFGAETASECLLEYKAKQFRPDRLNQINENISKNWNDIAQQISAIMLPTDTIYKTLKAAGCPLEPIDIGWNDAQYQKAVNFTKFSRGRFTFLDLG